MCLFSLGDSARFATRRMCHVPFILNMVSCIFPMTFGEFDATPGKLIFQKLKSKDFQHEPRNIVTLLGVTLKKLRLSMQLADNTSGSIASIFVSEHGR